MPGDKRMKDLAQSNWVSETCRNIQAQVIKSTAFNNRLALRMKLPWNLCVLPS